MPSDDQLLISVFKEIAVVQGKRTPEGLWIDGNPWHVQNALEVAMRFIENAKSSVSKGTKTAAPFTSTRMR
jgi:hypothetical protein